MSGAAGKNAAQQGHRGWLFARDRSPLTVD
jgi:hypothetical protein